MDEVAPIAQLLLTIQFEPQATQLSIFDLADLREWFSEYVLVQQVGRAGPMNILPALPVGDFNPAFPRVQMSHEDLNWVVLFQEDRVSVGWNRISSLEEPANYAGFKVVLARMLDGFSQVAAYLKSKGLPQIHPVVGEVGYTDALLLTAADGSPLRVRDVLNLTPPSGLAFNSINAAMTRILQLDYPAHAEVYVAGPGASPTGQPVAQLQTVVRFALETDGAVQERFAAAHDEATVLYKALVKSETHAISGE